MPDFVHKYTSMDDFRAENGTVRWVEYNAAQRNNGELCLSCAALMYPPSGSPRICEACKALTDTDGSEPVDHDSRVRCPFCGHTEDVDWELGIYSEGDHEISCNSCGKSYTVSVSVAYTFTSPAMGRSSLDDDPEDETDEG